MSINRQYLSANAWMLTKVEGKLAMGRVAILNIDSGDFERGFAVSLQISEDRGSVLGEVAGTLPPNLDISGFYVSWQTRFRSLNAPDIHSRQRQQGLEDNWQIDESLPINRSIGDDLFACRQLVKSLETNMKNWLRSPTNLDWQKIRERLVREFANDRDEIRLAIKAKNLELWKLPWHVWDLLEEFPHVGISYSLPEFEQAKTIPKFRHRTNQVRILAVLGDNRDIDLEADRRAIEQLKDANTVFLSQPRSRELIKMLRDPKSWDILFFAGHSQTKIDNGRIYLNEWDSLEIDDFNHAIKQAIYQGLKIAIFNSCDGLGLAQNLADLHIPVAIVMQEAVPDRVAQSFLTEFLAEYARGTSLLTSVRRAQTRLEEFPEFPGCTWLPIVCQNPAEVPPNWANLRDGKLGDRSSLFWPQMRQVILSSLGVTLFLLLARYLGFLQSLELAAFDRLMQMRLPEPTEERILVVAVTDADLQYQDEKGWNRQAKSLADPALSELLQKLNAHQPRAIGLDLYRDFPVDANAANLTQELQNNRLIATCLVGVDRTLGIAPPPEISGEDRLGFSNFPQDPKGMIRRQFLGMSPDRGCPTSQSLSFQVALKYLKAENISPIGLTANRELQIGSVILPQLTAAAGGYKLPNSEAQGYQIMINYRAGDAPIQQVRLKEILDGSLDAKLIELVKDKIILIGTTAETYQDLHLTPYSTGQWPEKMPGVMIHAHMVSQIISAVLDGRSLLGWWPESGEFIWIWSSSLVGGLLAGYLLAVDRQQWSLIWASKLPDRLIQLKNVWIILGTGSGAIATLSAVCWFGLMNGIWLPLVPSGLGLICTGGIILYCRIW